MIRVIRCDDHEVRVHARCPVLDGDIEVRVPPGIPPSSNVHRLVRRVATVLDRHRWCSRVIYTAVWLDESIDRRGDIMSQEDQKVVLSALRTCLFLLKDITPSSEDGNLQRRERDTIEKAERALFRVTEPPQANKEDDL